MSDEKYKFKQFLKYNNLHHGVSSKTFGSMKKDNGDLDYDNLKAFRKSVGINVQAVCMRQIHSGNVFVVNDTKEMRVPETDGLITNKKHIPLAVLTADCLPVLFFDPEKEAIGAAHAGYLGLLNHIIENTVEQFVNEFGSNPKDIIVGIGPSIERDCYEFGKDKIEEFQKIFPEFENIFIERNGKFYLDLRSIAQQCLAKAGILREHIEVMDICTKCDPNFYSYRGGDKDKRFASMICLKSDQE